MRYLHRTGGAGCGGAIVTFIGVLRLALQLWIASLITFTTPTLGEDDALKRFERSGKLGAAEAMFKNAEALAEQAQFQEAEQQFLRLLSTLEANLGRDHGGLWLTLRRLSWVNRSWGRYEQSVNYTKRALALAELRFGPEHFNTASDISNLAELYRELGRNEESEALIKRAITIYEATPNLDPQYLGTSLNNLAGLYQELGRYDDAEPLHQRGLALRIRSLGPDHPDVAQSLDNLGLIYRNTGRFHEAMSYFERSLAIRQKAFGDGHPEIGVSLIHLSILYRNLDRFANADVAGNRGLAILQASLGPDHPNVEWAHDAIAILAARQQDWPLAAQHWRSSTGIIQSRIERGVSGSANNDYKQEAERKGSGFEALVKATYRLGPADEKELKDRAAAMFKTAQWALGSKAADAIAGMAARSASGSKELTAAIRERQDLIKSWRLLDSQLFSARSQSSADRDPISENRLAQELRAVSRKRAAIDERLAREFPEYTSLANPQPVSIEEVQAILSDDEALIMTFDTGGNISRGNIPQETFVWAVTKSDVRWARAGFEIAGLLREVTALRCGLDVTAWTAKDSPCSRITGISYTEADYVAGRPPPFDAVRANGLYNALFGEIADLIKDKKHLLIAASGPLTTLPFHVLVVEPPSNQPEAVHWLVRDHAITLLPAVSSLKALRRVSRPSSATNPLISFANPLIQGDPQNAQHRALAKQAQAAAGCAHSPSLRSTSMRGFGRRASLVPQSTGSVDVGQIRSQLPLPETADEACEVARNFGSDTREVRVGKSATETVIKRLSGEGKLANYKVVHFATHGNLAGQLDSAREPGLILTPPEKPNPTDDGYLSASEIAALRLDADWVILSACNTAGGSGSGEGAEALSGLARAFFHAQARALLVSHWEVDSAATVQLITTTISALAKSKDLGRAEALRNAMNSMMTDTSRPADSIPASHPSIWAPFVVVGEGGARR